MSALLLFLFVPLAAALYAPLLLLPGGRRLLPAAPWLPLAALALVPFRGERVELPWLLLDTRLGIDAISQPFLLLAVVVWTLAGWHARRRLAAVEQPRFFFFWSMTWCGNLGVFICLDATSFYAAYALLTFAAYGLVVHRQRQSDFRAGRVYIWMSVIGEGLLLAALLMLVGGAGNVALDAGPVFVAAAEQAHIISLLMLLGFGVKTGIAGLHMWLPLAHPSAPVPASAVLSGVILKGGLLGWLRFLPIGQSGFETLGILLLALGFAGQFGAVLAGVMQRKVKELLAYSSVSQMGLLAVIVALPLLEPRLAEAAVRAAVLFALHHGLNKGLLFLGVDLLQAAPRLMRRLLWVPAAALAGLPLTTGALAKAGIKDALPEHSAVLGALLSATSAATAVLMVRFLALALTGRRDEQGVPRAPWLLLFACAAALPYAWAWLEVPVFVETAAGTGQVADAFLPVAVGAVLGLMLERLLRARRLPELPAGDVLALVPTLPEPFFTLALRPPRLAWRPPLSALELRLGRLAVAITALVAGLLLLFFL